MLEDILNVKLDYTQLPPRVSDQKVFVADITKITNAIGWKPKVSSQEGIERMIKWSEQITK